MKNLLLTIVLIALSTLASARPEGDTITQPILVVGRQLDESGNVVAQYNLDFSYNLDGTLKEFLFPGREKTQYHYYGDSIYYEQTLNYKFTYWGEDCYWYYDKNDKLDRMEHLWEYNYFGNNEYLYFYYDEDDRLIRKDCGGYPNHIETYWTWEYSEDGKEVTETYQTMAPRPLQRNTYHYDEIHTLLSKQVEIYDNAGVVSSTKLTAYSYTPYGKTETETTQALNDGEWVNSSIVEYAYDDKDRVTEIRFGSWNLEEQSWHITRKKVFEYEEEMKTTITFLKLVDEQWVWDDYSSYEPIFFDPPMNTIHQRAMRFLGERFYYCVEPSVSIDPVNQLEITYAFTGIPNYMDVPQAAKTDVVVYPNPGREEVTVRAATERAVIRFYDQQGRLVVSKPFDFSTSVSTGNWSPGLYIWEVWHDTQREASGKWIKK